MDINIFFDHTMFGDVNLQKERDNERQAACNYLDITYIEVPYWWQHDKESILAIIHKYREDIVPEAVDVIPFEYSSRKISQLALM